MSELQAARAAYRARETEEKRQAERRRNALVLILRHLVDHGYTAAYERLSTECNLSLNKVGCVRINAVCRHARVALVCHLQVDVADNVDLIRVVQEFEDSHELKYGRRPKLVRRVGGAAQSEYDVGGNLNELCSWFAAMLPGTFPHLVASQAQPMPVPVKPPLQRNLSAGAAATAPSPPNGVLSSVPGGLPAVGRSPGVAPQQAPVQYGNNGLEGPPIRWASRPHSACCMLLACYRLRRFWQYLDEQQLWLMYATLVAHACSGAVAAQRRRERGTLSAEDAKRAEALERRQRAMDR
jgi:hypothetical protein